MNKWFFAIILVILLGLLVGGALDGAQAAGDPGAQINVLGGEQTGLVSVSQAPAPFQVLVAAVIGFCLMLAVLPMFLEERQGLVE